MASMGMSKASQEVLTYLQSRGLQGATADEIALGIKLYRDGVQRCLSALCKLKLIHATGRCRSEYRGGPMRRVYEAYPHLVLT